MVRTLRQYNRQRGLGVPKFYVGNLCPMFFEKLVPLRPCSGIFSYFYTEHRDSAFANCGPRLASKLSELQVGRRQWMCLVSVDTPWQLNGALTALTFG